MDELNIPAVIEICKNAVSYNSFLKTAKAPKIQRIGSLAFKSCWRFKNFEGITEDTEFAYDSFIDTKIKLNFNSIKKYSTEVKLTKKNV